MNNFNNITLKKGQIGFVALGGLGEVGKNTYLLEYNNKIYIIDAGIMFADDDLLGIDSVIPNYEYLIKNQERIAGLFITHGHEDHIGAIPYLLQKVNIPAIYASGIAVDLILKKLKEFKNIRKPKIIKYKSHSKFRFDKVEISFVRLTHSIPESHGIVFKTPHGTIFHTGDYKLDLTPVGPTAEFNKLARLGEENLLCLLADSTNAERERPIDSESKIGDSITDLFGVIKNRIVIVTFASNLYRIQQIIDASVANGRKIAVSGRSLENTIEIGLNTGYIKAPKGSIIDLADVKKYKPTELTIIATGSQGEPYAALSRIANGSHKQIQAEKGDTVIFSSSPIPGNHDSINKIINMLYRRNIDVIVDGPLADTHTSGHGSQPDLKLMLCLTKPKYFIPIHGEHRMLKAHKELGRKVGINPNNVLVLDNGDYASISNREIKKIGKIPADDIYIDGQGIGDIGNAVLWERKKLSDEGIVLSIITINSNIKKLLTEPTLVSRGFIYLKANTNIIDKLNEVTKKFVLNEFKNSKQLNLFKLRKDLILLLEKEVFELTHRNPVCQVIIRDLC